MSIPSKGKFKKGKKNYAFEQGKKTQKHKNFGDFSVTQAFVLKSGIQMSFLVTFLFKPSIKHQSPSRNVAVNSVPTPFQRLPSREGLGAGFQP